MSNNTSDKLLIDTLAMIVSPQAMHNNAVAHGWYEGADLSHPDFFPAKLSLIHSECTEALEAYRDGAGDKEYTGVNRENPHPVEELADVVIRVFDICEAYGWPILKAITDKHLYNKSRPYRHGGKKV